MQVQAAGCSNMGQVRSVNQDRYAVRTPHKAGTWDALLMVADGMGGHQAGEIASELAVDQVVRVCESADTPRTDLQGTLRRAIVEANDTIRRAAAADPALHGMGTTVTAALLQDDRLYVGHVGDSRLYLVRGPSIFQLTQDHSWVAREFREGRLSQAEAEHHPERHVLTQAVGGKAHVNADTAAYPLENGDVLLLCTDGLSTLVDGREVIEVTRGFWQPSVAAEQLVALANHRGAPDNVTAVVARVADRQGGSRRTREFAAPRRRFRRRRTIAIALGGGAVIVTLIGVALAAPQELANAFAHLLGQS